MWFCVCHSVVVTAHWPVRIWKCQSCSLGKVAAEIAEHLKLSALEGVASGRALNEASQDEAFRSFVWYQHVGRSVQVTTNLTGYWMASRLETTLKKIIYHVYIISHMLSKRSLFFVCKNYFPWKLKLEFAKIFCSIAKILAKDSVNAIIFNTLHRMFGNMFRRKDGHDI